MIKKIFLFLPVLALFLTISCGSKNADNNVEDGQASKETKIVDKLASEGALEGKGLKYAIVDNMFVPENVPMIVEFSTTWCKYCKEYQPVFDACARQYESQAIFLTVDGDENPELVKSYGVSGYPTTVFILPSGGVLGVVPGVMTKSQIDTYMDQLLAQVAGEGMSL